MIEVRDISQHLSRGWLSEGRVVLTVGSRRSVNQDAIGSEAKAPKLSVLGNSYPMKIY